MHFAFLCAISVLSTTCVSAFAQQLQKVSDDTAKVSSHTIAQNSDTTDRLVVRANRIARLTPSQTILKTGDFSGKYQDLQSVLETVSGVTVHNAGGYGHYSETSIRGSSANQVQVYIDGIPQNGSTGMAVDISKIPLQMLQEIAVYKNIPPIELFGDNAGGILNLSTATNKEIKTATVEIGSFGYKSGCAFINTTVGQMTHRLAIDYGYADNNYPYTDSLITYGPTVKTDDKVKQMDNNSFSTFSSLYSNIWKINDKNILTTQLSARRTAEGIFYLPQADSNDGSIKTTTLAFTGKYDAKIDSSLSCAVTVKAQNSDELFSRSKPFYVYTKPLKNETNQPYTSLVGIVKKKLWERLIVTAFASGSYSGYTYQDLYLPQNLAHPQFFRLDAKIGAEAVYSIFSNVAARAGAIYKYDMDSVNGAFSRTVFLPGGGTAKEHFPAGFFEMIYEPWSNISFLASARNSSRNPGFDEKYCIGATVVGDTNLRPETRQEYNIGFAINKTFFATSTSIFINRTKDKIVFTMNSQHLFVPQNMDTVKGWGIENDTKLFLTSWLTVTNTATYMENIIHSSAQPLQTRNDEPLLPRFTDDLGVKFTYKKFYVSHSAHFISPYFVDADNTVQIVHAIPELNASIGFMANTHFDISYRVENYLNVMNYDFPDKATPGIRHFVVLKCNF